MNDDKRALEMINDPRYYQCVEETMIYDFVDSHLQSEKDLHHLVDLLFNEPESRVFFYQEEGKPNRILLKAKERREILLANWEGGFYRDPAGVRGFVKVPPPSPDGTYKHEWQMRAVESSPAHVRFRLSLTRRKEREMEAAQVAECMARVEDKRDSVAKDESVSPASESDASDFEFIDKGGVWSITFEGTNKLFPKRLIGFAYIYILLMNPDTPIPVLEIQSMEKGSVMLAKAGATETKLKEEEEKNPIQEYYELKKEVENAVRLGDSTQEAIAKKELESCKAILGVLTSQASQKVVSISNSVRDSINRAIARIKEELPECANHLKRSIHKGKACRYSPSPDVPWMIS